METESLRKLMAKDCIRLTSEEKEIQGRYLEALEGERKQAVYFSISESLYVPSTIYTENAGCMVSRKSSTQSKRVESRD